MILILCVQNPLNLSLSNWHMVLQSLCVRFRARKEMPLIGAFISYWCIIRKRKRRWWIYSFTIVHYVYNAILTIPGESSEDNENKHFKKPKGLSISRCNILRISIWSKHYAALLPIVAVALQLSISAVSWEGVVQWLQLISLNRV